MAPARRDEGKHLVDIAVPVPRLTGDDVAHVRHLALVRRERAEAVLGDEPDEAFEVIQEPGPDVILLPRIPLGLAPLAPVADEPVLLDLQQLYGMLRCDQPGERRLSDFDVAVAMRGETHDRP